MAIGIQQTDNMQKDAFDDFLDTAIGVVHLLCYVVYIIALVLVIFFAINYAVSHPL